MPNPTSSDVRAGGDERRPIGTNAVEVVRKTARRPEDTIAGCEALAASDLNRAAAMDTRNGRLKLEHSAASWQERAAFLRRIEISFNKRKALDGAERERAGAADLAKAIADADRREPVTGDS
ncbi:MAG TPA: hypothetical protein VJ859_12385 [Allosphingosinicella sp.]|nr:hypothetical protein [Allosphingosinicella sp.]